MDNLPVKGVGLFEQRLNELDSVNPAFLPVSLLFWVPFVLWLILFLWPIRTEHVSRLRRVLELPLVLAIFLGTCWGFVAGAVECVELLITPSATTAELVTLGLFLLGKSSLWGLSLTGLALGTALVRVRLCRDPVVRGNSCA